MHEGGSRLQACTGGTCIAGQPRLGEGQTSAVRPVSIAEPSASGLTAWKQPCSSAMRADASATFPHTHAAPAAPHPRCPRCLYGPVDRLRLRHGGTQRTTCAQQPARLACMCSRRCRRMQAPDIHAAGPSMRTRANCAAAIWCGMHSPTHGTACTAGQTQRSAAHLAGVGLLHRQPDLCGSLLHL